MSDGPSSAEKHITDLEETLQLTRELLAKSRATLEDMTKRLATDLGSSDALPDLAPDMA